MIQKEIFHMRTVNSDYFTLLVPINWVPKDHVLSLSCDKSREFSCCFNGNKLFLKYERPFLTMSVANLPDPKCPGVNENQLQDWLTLEPKQAAAKESWSPG